MEMFHYIAAIPALFLGLLLIRIGLSGFRIDRTEAGKNRARIDSWRDILMGRVRPKDDWMPDSRVQCGMVYNHKEGRLEVSGRLSVESLKRGIRRPG
ncbi:MAG: hypothetical protein JJU21_16275 [Salinarimonas sp.]|nr:hypothetical protein [Salinarimonas sp.]